ncbi:PAS domain S-box protein [Ideonella sp. A 288]|uniref:sensor domain-containing diguanylate cyclase n=1 Tax=Ideonella sp. A 288 TaxID=1962181 RepID=UPI0013037A2D|nr:PAS domain S-box protein [Ideonella sp. A 288]
MDQAGQSGPDAARTASSVAVPVGPRLHFDQIIQRSPVGMALIDADGLYRAANRSYCDLYGWHEDELLGRSFTQLFAPALRPTMLQRHRSFLAGEGSLDGEYDLQRRDGSPVSVLTESVRLAGDDPGEVHRLVHVVDITVRRRMEMTLADSQRFVQSVLDALSAHVCVLDDQGMIVAVNQAWRNFCQANDGTPAKTQEGTNYLAVCELAALSGTAQAPEAKAFAPLLREVLEGRRAEFQFEYGCPSPEVPRWFVVRVSRIAGSMPGRVVVAHDDVTALKLAQQALQQREAALLDLTASIPGAMFRLIARGGDRTLTYVSPGVEDLLGLTPEQVIADRGVVLRGIVPEDQPAYEASSQAALQNLHTWEVEFRFRLPDGALKWIHAKASPKPGERGETMWTGVMTDVSERKRIEAGLRHSEETFRTLFETVAQGVVYQDADGRILSANPAAQRILGLTLDQMQGRRSIDPQWHAIREDGTPFPGEEHPAMQVLRTGQPVRNVVMGVARPDQRQVWILVSAVPLQRNGQLEQVYASFEDITDRVRLESELRLQATTDFLTGAANRRSFMARLEAEFERLRRHADMSSCVMVLDLDHFKLVNDRHGHAVGDAVLRHVVQLMREQTRRLDMVGRCGGEEFAVLLPDTRGDEAMVLAERLRERVQQCPLELGDLRVEVTVSIGISPMSARDASPEAAMLRADQALYEVKHLGRNALHLAPAPPARSAADQ